jgi:hypothetical protein
MQIGTGEMRVLSSTAPANTMMQTLGGSVPPINQNQQWVLVEVLIVCNNSSDCSPSTSEFQLMSGNNTYPSTLVNIESALGDGVIASGQVWGHLAFVIPRTEQPTLLHLHHANHDFRFALQ